MLYPCDQKVFLKELNNTLAEKQDSKISTTKFRSAERRLIFLNTGYMFNYIPAYWLTIQTKAYKLGAAPQLCVQCSTQANDAQAWSKSVRLVIYEDVQKQKNATTGDGKQMMNLRGDVSRSHTHDKY